MQTGRFILVSENNGNLEVHTSMEFENRMAVEHGSCGEQILKSFTSKNIKSIDDFNHYVSNFNEMNFGDKCDMVTWKVDTTIDAMFAGVTDLFDLPSYPYHCDFMYWMNIASQVVEILTDDGVVQIHPNQGAIFNNAELYHLTDDENPDDEWVCDFLNDSSLAVRYYDDVRRNELMEELDLEYDEAQELIDNHMDHPHQFISVYDCYEDIGEEYLTEKQVDDYACQFIELDEVGKDIVKNSECYYVFDCSDRILYYMP